MKNLILILALVTGAWACGTERWDVKTMADADAAKISGVIFNETVDELSNLTPPANLNKPGRFPDERRMERVRARYVGFKGPEEDEDFHVVINSLTSDATMIFEVPSPHCMPRYAKQLKKMRALIASLSEKSLTKGLKRALRPTILNIEGPAFFDKCHGQTGRAKNCIEIHPALSVTVADTSSATVCGPFTIYVFEEQLYDLCPAVAEDEDRNIV